MTIILFDDFGGTGTLFGRTPDTVPGAATWSQTYGHYPTQVGDGTLQNQAASNCGAGIAYSGTPDCYPLGAYYRAYFLWGGPVTTGPDQWTIQTQIGDGVHSNDHFELDINLAAGGAVTLYLASQGVVVPNSIVVDALPHVIDVHMDFGAGTINVYYDSVLQGTPVVWTPNADGSYALTQAQVDISFTETRSTPARFYMLNVETGVGVGTAPPPPPPPWWGNYVNCIEIDS